MTQRQAKRRRKISIKDEQVRYAGFLSIPNEEALTKVVSGNLHRSELSDAKGCIEFTTPNHDRWIVCEINVVRNGVLLRTGKFL